MENDTEEDRVRQTLNLLAQYGVGPDLSPDPYQSDPSAKPLKDFFTEGD
jgi:hypothetical protein